MKSYELKPTYENLLNTYKQDVISRNEDIFRFIKILNSIEDNFSIALGGSWGSGKTFFVKQVKMVMDALNDSNRKLSYEDKEAIKEQCKNKFRGKNHQQVCIYYDAWEKENEDDPILSLIYAMLTQVDKYFSLKDENKCTKIAATLIERFRRRDWKRLIENLKVDCPLDQFTPAESIESVIRDFVDQLLLGNGERIVVFVDELERCRPSYAIKVLGRMEHYFSDKRITFVLSVNADELQNITKEYYGGDFDSNKYLERFFDLRVTLPPADLKKYYQSMTNSNIGKISDIVCRAVIKQYRFELRDIEKYLESTRMVESSHVESYSRGYSVTPRQRAIQLGICYVIPIALGLKVHDAKKYNDFVEGVDGTPLTEFSSCIDAAFFEDLLDMNETYLDSQEGKVKVTINQKLLEVYDAIFKRNYDWDTQRMNIGMYNFDHESRHAILRELNLFGR